VSLVGGRVKAKVRRRTVPPPPLLLPLRPLLLVLFSNTALRAYLSYYLNVPH